MPDTEPSLYRWQVELDLARDLICAGDETMCRIRTSGEGGDLHSWVT